MYSKVFLKIINCKQCPCCRAEITQGSEYAVDYFCYPVDGSIKIKLKGYVESEQEEPQDNEIPDHCCLTRIKNV